MKIVVALLLALTFRFTDADVTLEPGKAEPAHSSTAKHDNNSRDAAEEKEEKTYHKRKIIGLKTILLKYFIMPIKSTLAFIFDEHDPDTHYVMKKSKNEDNFSHADGENQNKTKKPEKIYSCKKNNDTSSVVHYIPDSSLVSEMNSSAGCGTVIFYSKYCKYSVEILPIYNALARIYPKLKLYAVEITSYSSSCLQFGAVGTPTILFYYNTRPIQKLPPTARNLSHFVEFFLNHTDLKNETEIEIIPEDYEGVELLHSNDWKFLFSSVFLTLSAIYHTFYSNYGKHIVFKARKLLKRKDE